MSFKQILDAGGQCGVLMPAAWQERLQNSAGARLRAKRPNSPSATLGRQHALAPDEGEYLAYTGPLNRRIDQAIEREIIPRLMLAHKLAFASEAPGPGSIGESEVEHFAALAVTQGFGVSYAYLDVLRGRGETLQDIFLNLLSPAARYLGRLWEQDLCDFADVTIGLGCLQQLVRALSAEGGYSTAPLAGKRNALFAAVPGEQHTFGVIMLADFFQRAGWSVTTLNSPTADEIAGIARATRFDVIGLSASGDGFAEDLPKLIQRVRKASHNKAAGVMVGGPFFLANPGCAGKIGADTTAINGREALHNAGKLLDLIEQR